MRVAPSPSMYYECAITDPTSNACVRKGRVTKAIRERRERRKTMAMLQRMVPTAKADDSPLELLLHVMEYISALTQQLQEFDAEAENRAPPIDISNLSQLFAHFSTSINRVSSGHNAQVLSARM
uniref:BHLH domain-containing protein n=1 Tax=Parascaris univalens TaxID=6257 RepID=A0A915AZZ4_PARUN